MSDWAPHLLQYQQLLISKVGHGRSIWQPCLQCGNGTDLRSFVFSWAKSEINNPKGWMKGWLHGSLAWWFGIELLNIYWQLLSTSIKTDLNYWVHRAFQTTKPNTQIHHVMTKWFPVLFENCDLLKPAISTRPMQERMPRAVSAAGLQACMGRGTWDPRGLL